MSDEINQWLADLGLQQYAEAFAEHAIEWAHLPDLDHESLHAIGVHVVGHRITILKAAADVAGTQADTDDTGAVGSQPVWSEAERRRLTVMFCDLVGSTRLSQQLDPEDLREVIATYQQSCKDAISRYDGYVARYMGDGVLAYFGYPNAHEDDPERAVRAGLAVVDQVTSVETGHGHPLKVRVGIATGLVIAGDIVGEGSAEERAVIGDTPNIASRLQSIARPNSVNVAASTQRLTASRFNYSDLGLHELKGIGAATRVWRALEERAMEESFNVSAQDRSNPLVGREPEVELLLSRWQQASEGEGQVVLISGEAGIGKSRLLRELQHRLGEGLRNRVLYFGSPYHQNSAFYPARDQLSRGFRFSSDDGPQQKLDKLEHGLSTLGLALEQIVPLLASLQHIPTQGRYASSDHNPERVRRELIEAIVAVTEAMTVRHPVLQVVEDAHWMDPSMLEFVGQCIERLRSLPVLHIISYRPGFESPWRPGPNITYLTLNNLSRADSSRLARQVARRRRLPDELMARIVDKTDGVPLFLEELTKSALELDTSAADNTRFAAPNAGDLEIPDSLHDSLLARLDRLTGAREVVQLAATIGRRFDHRLLVAVSTTKPSHIDNALTQLMEAGLVYKRGHDADAVYEFKHALVHDAAYGTLLHKKRRQLHARIAQVLTAKFGETVDAHPELVAYHSSKGERWEDAVKYWRLTGEEALERAAHSEAVRCFEMALAALSELPEQPTTMQQAVDLRMKMRVCLFALGQFDQMHRHISEAEKIADRLGDKRLIANIIVHKSWSLDFLGNPGGAIDAGRRALAIADALGERPLSALAGTAIGFAYWHTGMAREAIASFNRDVEYLCSELRHQRLGQTGVRSIFALSNLARSHAYLGEFDQGIACGERAREIATEIDNPYDLAYALWSLGFVHLRQGDFEAGGSMMREVLDTAATNELRVLIGWASAELGYADIVQGRVDSGLRSLERSIAVERSIGNPYIRNMAGAYMGFARLEGGSPELARREALTVLRVARQRPYYWVQALALRLLAEIYAGHDASTDRARRYFDKVVAVCDRFEFRPELAHCYRAMAECGEGFSDPVQKRKWLDMAAQAYASLGMAYWTRRVEDLDPPANV